MLLQLIHCLIPVAASIAEICLPKIISSFTSEHGPVTSTILSSYAPLKAYCGFPIGELGPCQRILFLPRIRESTSEDVQLWARHGGPRAAIKLKLTSNENNTLTPAWQPFLSQINLDGRTTLSVKQGRGPKDTGCDTTSPRQSSATAYHR